jgi:hypothetical protein
MSIAFVVGNGTSRKPVNLTKLKQHGLLYACNAVYREGVNPDYLVAVDTKMVTEINRSQYQIDNSVWTNPNKLFEKFHKFNYFATPLGWSSGPTALWLATNTTEHTHDQIYILGFDFEGTQGKINNLYADTENYKRSTEVATYHGNWSRQTGIIIQKNVQKRYIRVVENKDDYCPDNLRPLGNLSHMTTKEFMEKFMDL